MVEITPECFPDRPFLSAQCVFPLVQVTFVGKTCGVSVALTKHASLKVTKINGCIYKQGRV